MRHMARCHHCGSKFGLIRHRIGSLQFCRRTCKEAYQEDRQKEVRLWAFQKWLNLRPS